MDSGSIRHEHTSSERQTVGRRRPVPDELFGGRLRGSYLLDLEVAAVEQIASHVRLVTMASPDLVGFEHTPGQDLLIEFPDGDRAVHRRYTIRRSDPAEGTADLEIEIHDGRGPASIWVAPTSVGDHFEAIGPRGAIELRPATTSHLFVVDDSAMPAAFAMLESLPATTSATAVLVTDHGASSRPALDPQYAGAQQVSFVWLDRAAMPQMLRDLHPVTGTAAYLFGERDLVREAQELLVAAGVDRDLVASKAYWRRGQPNASHGEPSR